MVEKTRKKSGGAIAGPASLHSTRTAVQRPVERRWRGGRDKGMQWTGGLDKSCFVLASGRLNPKPVMLRLNCSILCAGLLKQHRCRRKQGAFVATSCRSVVGVSSRDSLTTSCEGGGSCTHVGKLLWPPRLEVIAAASQVELAVQGSQQQVQIEDV